jgi:hypothetical protein
MKNCLRQNQRNDVHKKILKKKPLNESWEMKVKFNMYSELWSSLWKFELDNKK